MYLTYKQVNQLCMWGGGGSEPNYCNLSKINVNQKDDKILCLKCMQLCHLVSKVCRAVVLHSVG